ncbi:UNVERIFIED_CONTAM: hypothetical protein RMT77_005318 [Armadillidium vulgare]
MSEMETKQESLEPRQRKKKLIKDVKALLEFYFSPANITKDKFIQNLLSEDDYINLEVFLKFNKIKKLTGDANIIKKAVKKSDILELSEDECKMKRKLPIKIKENEMECTIYVENLPLNSTHDWLQKVFSLYGTIDYISLPRFRNNGRPKGFAFVEFSTPQEAQKAIESFGGLASLDGTLNPSDLLSIKTYEPQDSKEVNGKSGEEKIDQDTKSNKRTADVAFANEEEDKEENPNKKSKDETVEKESKKSKKKRKRNKKEKQYEIESVYLRVMAKKDWKSLRNKYLNLQRENMKQFKQRTIFGNKAFPQENKVAETNQPKFIPNVIVKFSLPEPLQNLKEFRIGLTSGRPFICYIDINSTEKDIFVRFKTPEAAKQFVEERLWDNVELLKGEEEEKYWNKIHDSWKECRNVKRQAKTGDSSLRGREKLITKAFKQKDKKPANSHIVFDE